CGARRTRCGPFRGAYISESRCGDGHFGAYVLSVLLSIKVDIRRGGVDGAPFSTDDRQDPSPRGDRLVLLDACARVEHVDLVMQTIQSSDSDPDSWRHRIATRRQ